MGLREDIKKALLGDGKPVDIPGGTVLVRSMSINDAEEFQANLEEKEDGTKEVPVDRVISLVLELVVHPETHKPLFDDDDEVEWFKENCPLNVWQKLQNAALSAAGLADDSGKGSTPKSGDASS